MKNFSKIYYVFMIVILSSSVAMAHQRCEIKEQDGSGEGMWCHNHDQDGSIRCYAEVKYTDGVEAKIWGDECYGGFADCWSSGKGAVEPKCSK